jgi:hypothetical protein
MFAQAEAQIVERLLDEAIGDFRIPAQLTGEGFVPRVHPSGFLAEQQARGYAGLSPRAIHFLFNPFHVANVTRWHRVGNLCLFLLPA